MTPHSQKVSSSKWQIQVTTLANVTLSELVSVKQLRVFIQEDSEKKDGPDMLNKYVVPYALDRFADKGIKKLKALRINNE